MDSNLEGTSGKWKGTCNISSIACACWRSGTWLSNRQLTDMHQPLGRVFFCCCCIDAVDPDKGSGVLHAWGMALRKQYGQGLMETSFVLRNALDIFRFKARFSKLFIRNGLVGWSIGWWSLRSNWRRTIFFEFNEHYFLKNITSTVELFVLCDTCWTFWPRPWRNFLWFDCAAPCLHNTPGKMAESCFVKMYEGWWRSSDLFALVAVVFLNGWVQCDAVFFAATTKSGLFEEWCTVKVAWSCPRILVPMTAVTQLSTAFLCGLCMFGEKLGHCWIIGLRTLGSFTLRTSTMKQQIGFVLSASWLILLKIGLLCHSGPGIVQKGRFSALLLGLVAEVAHTKECLQTRG